MFIKEEDDNEFQRTFSPVLRQFRCTQLVSEFCFAPNWFFNEPNYCLLNCNLLLQLNLLGFKLAKLANFVVWLLIRLE